MDADLALPFGVSRVTERLFLGGAISGHDHISWLAAQGVTHVISAAGELSDRALCKGCDLGYYHLRWYDDKEPKAADEFLQVLEWVLGEETALLRTGRQMTLYVHCAMGLNRGPLLAAFLLAARSALPADKAWATVKAARPAVESFDVPSYRQSCLTALEAFMQRPRADLLF